MEQKILKPFVLHVEDEDHSAYLLRLILREERADIDVFRLCNGEEAISFLTRRGVYVDAPQPDVVVLDLHMPKKNGHEVLAEIQQQTALQHVPLIVFSSSYSREDREKALALGAKNYFEKSIDLTSFVTVARQVIAYLPARG